MEGNHPLSSWLREQDPPLTQAWLAEKIGISQPHLTLALQGKRGLSLSAALSVERVTDGAVPAAAFVKRKERVA